MDPAAHNIQLRQVAFNHVIRLADLPGGVLDSADLAGGFEFGGERIPLINPQRGIFKPSRDTTIVVTAGSPEGRRVGRAVEVHHLGAVRQRLGEHGALIVAVVRNRVGAERRLVRVGYAAGRIAGKGK
jgi:hypothetical protein